MANKVEQFKRLMNTDGYKISLVSVFKVFLLLKSPTKKAEFN